MISINSWELSVHFFTVSVCELIFWYNFSVTDSVFIFADLRKCQNWTQIPRRLVVTCIGWTRTNSEWQWLEPPQRTVMSVQFLTETTNKKTVLKTRFCRPGTTSNMATCGHNWTLSLHFRKTLQFGCLERLTTGEIHHI